MHKIESSKAISRAPPVNFSPQEAFMNVMSNLLLLLKLNIDPMKLAPRETVKIIDFPVEISRRALSEQ